MTTTVYVSACCSREKEVVMLYDTGYGEIEEVLQDGEERTLYIHEPEHYLTVKEVDKK